MQVSKITFNVWAESEAEAEELSRAIGAFIDEQGQQGRRVTAKKLTEAISRWKENPLVRNTIINYFR